MGRDRGRPIDKRSSDARNHFPICRERRRPPTVYCAINGEPADIELIVYTFIDTLRRVAAIALDIPSIVLPVNLAVIVKKLLGMRRRRRLSRTRFYFAGAICIARRLRFPTVRCPNTRREQELLARASRRIGGKKLGPSSKHRVGL